MPTGNRRISCRLGNFRLGSRDNDFRWVQVDVNVIKHPHEYEIVDVFSGSTGVSVRGELTEWEESSLIDQVYGVFANEAMVAREAQMDKDTKN